MAARRRRADGPAGAPPGGGATPALPSPIEPLLEGLARLGFERPPGEPVRRWLGGLPLPAHREALARLAARHARWRFDPAAQSAGEAEALAVEALRLAQSIQAPPAPGTVPA